MLSPSLLAQGPLLSPVVTAKSKNNRKLSVIFLFMDDGSMTLIVALVILVAFSAFFSASETAFSSLNQIRLKSRAEDGDGSAARVLALSEKYDKLLSTILIGNNIVNIGAASIGTILFTHWLGQERGATMSTLVLTVVVLIFGEVTPKSLAKEMPETVATAVSPVLSLLIVLFTPLNWLFTQWKKLLGHFVHSSEEDTITEGELMTMVSEAENDGELTDRESELIRSAIEFDDVEVEEILTPRVDVVAVEDNTSLDEVAQTFAESGYSRLPVYHDTIDNIIGVVHEKDFYLARLKKETSLEELVKPTLYTTGSTQISQLLRTLREQHIIWPWWWMSTAVPRASSRWRIFWKSWWARSGTNTTRRPRTFTSSLTAAGSCWAAPVWMTCTRCWACRRTRTSTPTRSTAWCRKRPATCPRWATALHWAATTA